MRSAISCIHPSLPQSRTDHHTFGIFLKQILRPIQFYLNIIDVEKSAKTLIISIWTWLFLYERVGEPWGQWGCSSFGMWTCHLHQSSPQPKVAGFEKIILFSSSQSYWAYSPSFVLFLADAKSSIAVLSQASTYWFTWDSTNLFLSSFLFSVCFALDLESSFELPSFAT